MVASRFSVKVVGVTFHDEYPGNLHALRERFAKGVGEASLIREPDNQYDPYAVAVLAGGEIIGHVPRFLAEKLAPELDAGTRFRVVSAEVLVNPEHEDRPGFLIECERVTENSWANF